MTAAVIAAAIVLLGAAGCRVLLVRAVGREVTGRFIDGTRPPQWPAPALLRVAVDDAAIPVGADVVWVAGSALTSARSLTMPRTARR